ncbi:hypothetical protein GB937_010747, partial [Aspergillus fischeri]
MGSTPIPFRANLLAAGWSQSEPNEADVKLLLRILNTSNIKPNYEALAKHMGHGQYPRKLYHRAVAAVNSNYSAPATPEKISHIAANPTQSNLFTVRRRAFIEMNSSQWVLPSNLAMGGNTVMIPSPTRQLGKVLNKQI